MGYSYNGYYTRLLICEIRVRIPGDPLTPHRTNGSRLPHSQCGDTGSNPVGVCDVKSLKLTVWQQKPTKPAIPLAEAGVAGLISNDVVREPTLIVTLVENKPQGKVETASYKAVRVQASIAWLSK